MKKQLYLFMVLVMALSLFACQPVETAQPAVVAETIATEAPATEVPVEKVTLSVWDTFTEEGQSAGMDKMIEMFEASHPNIEIVRDAQTIDNLRPVVQTALGADNGPDIIYYDTGSGYAGVLADAGLLLPLDDAYEANNWNDRIYSWTKDRVTFDGKTYGIGNELEFIGVYYNKTIFEELGVSEPQTYEEFLQICDKAKAAGYTPIAFADGPKWPAYHQFSIMANNIAGKEKLDSILFGDGSWNDPDIVKSIKTFFVDMNQAGYFLPDTTAISYEDGNAVFYSGQAAMDITGTWLLSEMSNNVQDFEVDFFFFPSIDGKPVMPPGGMGSGYFVNAKTQHPSEAIEFLDFMFSEEGGKIWLEDMSIIPSIAVTTTDLNLTPLMKFAVNAVTTVPLGYNIDVLAGDNFNTAQGDGYQAVLLGLKTPEQLAEELQAAWLADK
jgi:raffinose/stachyose/melibiose transport system substrate-binding protein